MEEKITRIHNALQKLIGLHRQLLESVRAEKEALIKTDLKTIQEVTCAKEALIEVIRQQESVRLRLVHELGQERRWTLSELTISELAIKIQGFDPKGAESLRSAFNALHHLIARIREQNDDNRTLLLKSMEHIDAMKRNILGEEIPQAQTYGKSGQRSGGNAGSRLVSREA